MKILIFNYEYPPLGGGGGVVQQQLAEELGKRNDVVVVTSGHRDLTAREVVAGVQIIRVPVLGRRSLTTASLASMLTYYPAALYRGRDLVDRWKPDLINTHFAVPTGPAAVHVARRAGIPHALCVHGGDLHDPSKLLSPHRIPALRQTVRWVLRSVDRLIAQSTDSANKARMLFGFSDEITIIPHGLRSPELRDVPRAHLGLSEDQIILISVGRLVQRKATHRLVEILARLADPRVVLLVVGDGPERHRIEDAARRLGVAGRLIMPGIVSEERKFDYLRASDVFVSATTHEGFGLMFLEAMFCGLPVVTYDYGGHRDFLEDGRSGHLIPLGDEDRFVDRLGALLRNDALRAQMTRWNEDLSGQFTIERCAARYLDLFEEMIHTPIR